MSMNSLVKDATAVDSAGGDDDFFESLRKQQSKNDGVKEEKRQQMNNIVDNTPITMVLDTEYDQHSDIPELIENISPTSVDASISTSISIDEYTSKDSTRCVNETMDSKIRDEKMYHKTNLLSSIILIVLLALSMVDLNNVDWLSDEPRISKPIGITSKITTGNISERFEIPVRKQSQKEIRQDSTQLQEQKGTQGEEKKKKESAILPHHLNLSAATESQSSGNQGGFLVAQIQQREHQEIHDQQHKLKAQSQEDFGVQQQNNASNKKGHDELRDDFHTDRKHNEKESAESKQNRETHSHVIYEAGLTGEDKGASTSSEKTNADFKSDRVIIEDISKPPQQDCPEANDTHGNFNLRERFLRLTYALRSNRIKCQFEVLKSMKWVVSVVKYTTVRIISVSKDFARRLNHTIQDLKSTVDRFQAKSCVDGQKSVKQLMDGIARFAAHANDVTKVLASTKNQIQAKSHKLEGGEESMKHVRTFIWKRASRIMSRKLEVSMMPRVDIYNSNRNS